MSMQHPRLVVYAGAMTALVFMTVRIALSLAAVQMASDATSMLTFSSWLTRTKGMAVQIISTILGLILPNLISRQATQHAASLLYTIFGVRLLWIAWRSSPQESNQASILCSLHVVVLTMSMLHHVNA